MCYVSDHKLARFYFCIFLFIGITACGDYSISLPKNYSLVRVYSGAVLIKHQDDGIVVEANIDGYLVIDNLIIGHSSVAELAPENQFSKPGYFIIDTRTRSVTQALDQQMWLGELRKLGISEEPTLHMPSRWDRNHKSSGPVSTAAQSNGPRSE